jgi:hypothetical protein
MPTREGREARLQRLEEEAGDQVADRDRLDLVPDGLEPTDHVEAEQAADEHHDDDGGEPACDLEQTPRARRVVER